MIEAILGIMSRPEKRQARKTVDEADVPGVNQGSASAAISQTSQRTQLNVHKTGERIVIDNVGSDGETPGTNGIPFTSWSGSITGVISVAMVFQKRTACLASRCLPLADQLQARWTKTLTPR